MRPSHALFLNRLLDKSGALFQPLHPHLTSSSITQSN